MPVPLKTKNLVFITGPAGSGTTMLSRLLSSPEFSAALTRYSSSEGYERQSEYADIITHKMWHASNINNRKQRSMLGDYLKNIPINEHHSHIILKRSSPFTNMEYIPLLTDVADIFTDTKFIIARRAPHSCAISILRRNICRDIDTAIEWTKKVFQHISDELEKIDRKNYMVINYEDFIADPGRLSPDIEVFLSYPAGSLSKYISIVKSPTRESAILEQQYANRLQAAFENFQANNYS